MERCPPLTVFAASVARTVGIANLSRVLPIVGSSSISLNNLLRIVTQNDINDATMELSDSFNDRKASLDVILYLSSDELGHSQYAAELVEKLIMRLGRAIGVKLRAHGHGRRLHVQALTKFLYCGPCLSTIEHHR
jgi:hypothetical protein